MKVVCEYCGSYVEADENMKCPSCLAELGSAVQAEQKRVEQQEEAQRQQEAAEQAQEAKDEHVSDIIKGITSVATAVVAGVTATNVAKQENASGDEKWPEPPEGHRHHPHMSDDGRPSGPPEGFERPVRPDGSSGFERPARMDGSDGHERPAHMGGSDGRGSHARMDGMGGRSQHSHAGGPGGAHRGGMPGGHSARR